MELAKFEKVCNAVLPLLNNEEFNVQDVARILMLSYGDVYTKGSGLVSEKLVHHHKPTNSFYRKGRYTEEHFTTRTNTCRQVCYEYLEEDTDWNKIRSLLDVGRTVHYTTESENMQLRIYQQDLEKYPTWQSQYKATGIKLVEDPGMFGTRKYYYVIENVAYVGVNEAAAAIGCHPMTIKARCKKDKFDYKELAYA
tara:strand:+ start:511 stop:1098 length:588 start_codon:yes stop_codon:yes gene_type:complete